jgi:hypothetical protein
VDRVTFALANVTFCDANVASCDANVALADHNVTFCIDKASVLLLEDPVLAWNTTRASSHEAARVETGVAQRRADVALFRPDGALGACVVSSHSVKREGRDFL